MTPEDLNLFVGLGGAAIVAALVQVVKAVTAMSDDPWCRWNPLVAIVFGIGWNALIGSLLVPPMVWQIVILQGLLTGLGASGLYSGVKAVRGN